MTTLLDLAELYAYLAHATARAVAGKALDGVLWLADRA